MRSNMLAPSSECLQMRDATVVSRTAAICGFKDRVGDYGPSSAIGNAATYTIFLLRTAGSEK